jgi:hypothetical protein
MIHPAFQGNVTMPDLPEAPKTLIQASKGWILFSLMFQLFWMLTNDLWNTQQVIYVCSATDQCLSIPHTTWRNLANTFRPNLGSNIEGSPPTPGP